MNRRRRDTAKGHIDRVFQIEDEKCEVVCRVNYTLTPPTPMSYDYPGDGGDFEYDLTLLTAMFFNSDNNDEQIDLLAKDLPAVVKEALLGLCCKMAEVEEEDIRQECAQDANDADEAAYEAAMEARAERRRELRDES